MNEVRDVKIDDLSLQKASVSGAPGVAGTPSKIDDVDVYGTVDGKQVKLVKGMDYDMHCQCSGLGDFNLGNALDY